LQGLAGRDRVTAHFVDRFQGSDCCPESTRNFVQIIAGCDGLDGNLRNIELFMSELQDFSDNYNDNDRKRRSLID
jgi:hypothetical protein